MARTQADLLSTGEVARLCGVSRDAVLKWIKSGKLPATQTPGGHYRVPRSAFEGLAIDGEGNQLPINTSKGESVESEPLRCWEYFGENGDPREACES